ncbi:glutamate racemase, partial [Pseudomonas fragi]
GVVGVLATTGTLQSAKFAALLDRFATDVRVITQPCPGLVELIEAGDLNSPALHSLLQGYIEPLLSAGCDTIILGCTHYP